MCAECSTYHKISQFWRAVSRNLASEGNFKKSFTKNALFQKLISKKHFRGKSIIKMCLNPSKRPYRGFVD